MAWTAPRTWTVAEVVTAAQLNEQLRDNMLAAFPVGCAIPFTGGLASIPALFLAADGSAISRASYPSLFAMYNAAGLPYGSGNGSTTFNLPDLRGRGVFGVATGAPLANALGDNDGKATIAERGPSHRHTVTDPGHTHSITYAGPGGATNLAGDVSPGDSPAGSVTPVSTNTTGITVGISTQPLDAPASMALFWIVKALD